MIATNAAGPRTVRYGSIRRWVEALEIVEADGSVRILERGAGNQGPFTLTPDSRLLIPERFPKTRKNSSGYALDRFAESGDEVDLLVGSEGTLAIVTKVEWRLDPIPPGVAGAALGFADLRVSPDPVRVASEGALWGAVREQGLLGQAIVVSDGPASSASANTPCAGCTPNAWSTSSSQPTTSSATRSRSPGA